MIDRIHQPCSTCVLEAYPDYCVIDQPEYERRKAYDDNERLAAKAVPCNRWCNISEVIRLIDKEYNNG